ncbi:MAG: hypothetical protein KatS3mg084_0048 [Candidatus Dojkabacteria bacterium]|nr:MAG: hypothetical protein KatS3mg084_0048 [Candidatus Dojkabacteria bacterium]
MDILEIISSDFRLMSVICPNLIFVLTILGFLAWILVSNQKTKATSISQNNAIVIRDWLLEQKAKGLSDIDQLIGVISEESGTFKDSLQQPSLNTVTAMPSDTPVSTPELVVKNNWMDTNEKKATFLLYFGSFLVTVSLFVLVVLSWQNLNDIVKNLILLCAIFGFYALGIFAYYILNLKDAAHTFYATGSIILGLSGIGFWNFGIKYTGADIKLYATIYSAIILLVNGALFAFIERKRFLYLSLLSLYIFVISFAFLLTQKDLYRYFLIVLANTGIYVASVKFAKIKKETYLFSSIVNWLLIIFIYTWLLISPSLSRQNTNWFDSLVIWLLCLMPTVHILISYFRNNARISLLIDSVLIYFKLIIISDYFRFDSNTILIILSIANILMVYFYKLFVFASILSNLGLLIGIFSQTLLNYIAIFGLFFDESALTYLDKFTFILFATATSFIYLFPWLLNRSKVILGFGLLYVIFITLRALFFYFHYIDPWVLMSLIGIIVLGLTSIVCWYKYKNSLNMQVMNIVLVGLSLLYTLLSLFIEDNLITSVNFVIITLSLVGLSSFFNNLLTRVISVVTFNVSLLYLLVHYAVPVHQLIIYLSVVNAVLSFSEWLSIGKIKEFCIHHYGLIAKLFVLVYMFIYTSYLFGHAKDFSPYYLLAIAPVFLISKFPFSNRLFGLPLLFFSWYYINEYHLSSQLYYLSTTLYLLSLSLVEFFTKHSTRSIVFESVAYFIQFFALFMDSLNYHNNLNTNSYLSVPVGTLYAFLLLLLSASVIVLGYIRDKKPIWIIGAIFLTLALLRLIALTVFFLWWLYLAIFGFIIIGIAVFWLFKLSRQ